ncbi:MAG: glycerol-3-phosphate 1-O-acyltransferase PlsY [Candidatus Limnocylindrales bacterium]|jgi:glycerol-3-phosphate acyltransferase PlsY
MQNPDLVKVAVALIAGYLIGGIPFGIIVPRLIGGPDPRTIGSGRTGGANVSRAVGFRWAAVSGLLDVTKGLAAVLLVIAIGGGPVPQVVAALAAIVGHSRSPFIGFHGGRGIAPATGGAIIIAPIILAAIFPVFVLTIAVTRISSIGSLSASLIGGIVMVVITAMAPLPPIYTAPLPPIYFVYGVGVPGLIWLFHVDNIERLLRGEERRIGRRSGA